MADLTTDQRITELEDELKILRDWIQAGAPWAQHWAFVPPRQVTLDDADQHPIDEIVRALAR